MTIFKNSSVISKESYFTAHHNVRCSPRSGLGCGCCAYSRSVVLNESRGLIFRCGLIFSRTHVHATSCVRFIDRSCSLLGISLCLLGAAGQTAFFVDFTCSHPASLCTPNRVTWHKAHPESYCFIQNSEPGAAWPNQEPRSIRHRVFIWHEYLENFPKLTKAF